MSGQDKQKIYHIQYMPKQTELRKKNSITENQVLYKIVSLGFVHEKQPEISAQHKLKRKKTKDRYHIQIQVQAA